MLKHCKSLSSKIYYLPTAPSSNIVQVDYHERSDLENSTTIRIIMNYVLGYGDRISTVVGLSWAPPYYVNLTAGFLWSMVDLVGLKGGYTDTEDYECVL